MRTALPFGPEFGPPLDLEALGALNRAGDGAPLLGGVLQDPHLAALDRDLDFTEAIRRSRLGTFDERAFLECGRRSIATYVRRARSRLRSVFTRDAVVAVPLEQKLICLASTLRAEPRPPSPPLGPSRRVEALFGRSAYRVPLAPVVGARLLQVDCVFPADSRYAWRISVPGDPKSRSVGTARPEFGRALFVDDVDVDPRTGAVVAGRAGAHARLIRTQVVVKGVGPTRYAGNRFSRRTSGVLTMLQGERDWQHSEILASGGVPVYRPIELTLLPYCHWHPQMGWWPMVMYARLPLENLRVSDLELLSARRGRVVLAELRSKLAALGGVAVGDLSEVAVVRFVVARLGRIAGLCESGATFEGRPFFHGFLHGQNVSLLGELVDLGEGRFVDGPRALTAAYAKSGYVNPARAWSASVRGARREVVPFNRIARHFAHRITRLLAPRPSRPPRGLDTLFRRSYDDGRAGARADCAPDVLQSSARGIP